MLPLAASAEGTHSIKLLTPETALKAAQAALKKCRDNGFQATVAVVDRMGVTQVLLRDRFAGTHTVEMARAKAWTAVSFRTNTTALAEATQARQPAERRPPPAGRGRRGRRADDRGGRRAARRDRRLRRAGRQGRRRLRGGGHRRSEGRSRILSRARGKIRAFPDFHLQHART